jgi:carboxyl-terminal processing protease
MSLDFAEYFFDEEILLSNEYYYSDRLGDFEVSDRPGRLTPAPLHYEGPVALLISPYCISACEGFANAMSQQDRSVVIGHFPTAGAYGEVGRGQYNLPEDLSLQSPTGRPETPDGKLLIEGQGVPPDLTVPVTEESALGKVDALLDKAEEVLLEKINP